MIKVSIIIPAYNIGKYLDKCLYSVINQTLREIEIIIINDGSTDNTQEIIDYYKSKDKRIISISQENSGPGEARNTGMKIAKGKYIGFIDSDDKVDKEMYKKMYEKAEKYKSDIVSCNHIREYDNNKFCNKIYNINKEFVDLSNYELDNFIKDDILTYAFGSEVWSKLIKKEIIFNNNITFKSHKEILGEDMLFLLECLLYVNKIVYINESLYIHRIRHNSLTNSTISNMSTRLLKLIETYKSLALSKNKFDSVESALPLLCYSYITDSLSYEKKFSKKYNVLKSISKSDVFNDCINYLLKAKNVGYIKKLFAFFCSQEYFLLAILLRKAVELSLQFKQKRVD